MNNMLINMVSTMRERESARAREREIYIYRGREGLCVRDRDRLFDVVSLLNFCI